MDNVITTTLALRQRRNHFPDPSQRLYWCKNPYTQKQIQEKAFQEWIRGLNRPQFHIFYRISGVRQFTSGRVQTKIYFMPCLKFMGENTIYKIYNDPFVFYIYVDNVENKADDWISVKATAASYPSQKLIVIPPPKYHLKVEDILPYIAFPAKVQERKRSNDAEPLDLISKQRFYRLQILYHLSDKYDERYGAVYQMWEQSGRKINLDPPPEFESFRESLLS